MGGKCNQITTPTILHTVHVNSSTLMNRSKWNATFQMDRFRIEFSFSVGFLKWMHNILLWFRCQLLFTHLSFHRKFIFVSFTIGFHFDLNFQCHVYFDQIQCDTDNVLLFQLMQMFKYYDGSVKCTLFLPVLAFFISIEMYTSFVKKYTFYLLS